MKDNHTIPVKVIPIRNSPLNKDSTKKGKIDYSDPKFKEFRAIEPLYEDDNASSNSHGEVSNFVNFPSSNSQNTVNSNVRASFSPGTVLPNESIRRTPGPKIKAISKNQSFGPIFEHHIPFASPLQQNLNQNFSSRLQNQTDSPDFLRIVDKILNGIQNDENFYEENEEQLNNFTDDIIYRYSNFNEKVQTNSSFSLETQTNVSSLSNFDEHMNKEKSYSLNFPPSNSEYNYIPNKNTFFRDSDSILHSVHTHGMSGPTNSSIHDLNSEINQLSIQTSNDMKFFDSQLFQYNEKNSINKNDSNIYNSDYSIQLPSRSISPNYNSSSQQNESYFPPSYSLPFTSKDDKYIRNSYNSNELNSNSNNQFNSGSMDQGYLNTYKQINNSSELSSFRDKKNDKQKPQSAMSIERLAKESANKNSITSKSFEISETPQARSACKEFYKVIRQKEREGFDAAKAYGDIAVHTIPDCSKWRVYAELADIAKRNDNVEMARKLYAQVCSLQPNATQSWLEWSKLEEECGEIKNSLKILREGLNSCKCNEALLAKAIKQQEKLNELEDTRGMLSILKHESIDRVWKSILEGALFEARDGKVDTAREFLKYLITQVPWYGPIYYEAYRLEEKCENFEAAYRTVFAGLKELPRYGPLWFGLLRLSERDDVQEEAHAWVCGVRPRLTRTREDVKRGVLLISRELVWKLYFEAGQIEERAADIVSMARHRRTAISIKDARCRLYSTARICYSESLLACPQNLRWKVWLAGARMELSAGRLTIARKLLKKAYEETPEKSRAFVYLECSRLEEFIGNVDGARKILELARRDVKHEWKVYLESVLVEARDGNVLLAILVAIKSLNLHAGTGRLWALLIQLSHRKETRIIKKSLKLQNHISLSGFETDSKTEKNSDNIFSMDLIENFDLIPSKNQLLLKALNEVPKSGEVWCEGARLNFNPLLLDSFDLADVQRQLNFAIQFTPQYGDTFIEYLRLEIIMQILLPKLFEALHISYVNFTKSFLNEDFDSDIIDVVRKFGTEKSFSDSTSSREIRIRNIIAINKFEAINSPTKDEFQSLKFDNLIQRCLNADPNYGTLWFACRNRSYDTPASIMKEAFTLLTHEIIDVYDIYMRALLRYTRKCMKMVINHYDVANSRKVPSKNLDFLSKKLFESLCIDLKEAKEIEEDFIIAENILKKENNNYDSPKLPFISVSGRTYASEDFVSGLVSINRSFFVKYLGDEDRRKILFGSDQIIP